MKIIVLAGGLSTERNVALTSGTGICRALRRRGAPAGGDGGHQYPVAGLEVPHELAHGNDLRAALVSQDHIVPLADGTLPDRMHI